MTTDYQYAFRAGFRRAMVAASAGDLTDEREAAIARDHTFGYVDGWRAGRRHFCGVRVDPMVDIAYMLGLPQDYAGFYGQSDWQHPIDLPGHLLERSQ